jgi:hypothetical protein
MLSHAPILTPPQGDEPLYLYIAATTQVVSAVIVVERTEEGHALLVRPVYLLTDKTRIHLRSASVRTYTFFTTGSP